MCATHPFLFHPRYIHYSLPLPSILSSVYSLPRSVRPSIFPFLVAPAFSPFHPPPTRFLSFSHVRTRARAFGLFFCFYAPLVFSLPKYNWRCDAPVSLSLSTLRLPFSPRALVRFSRRGPWVQLRRILDACRQLANSRLPQTGSANRPISRAYCLTLI